MLSLQSVYFVLIFFLLRFVLFFQSLRFLRVSPIASCFRFNRSTLSLYFFFFDSYFSFTFSTSCFASFAARSSLRFKCLIWLRYLSFIFDSNFERIFSVSNPPLFNLSFAIFFFHVFSRAICLDRYSLSCFDIW